MKRSALRTLVAAIALFCGMSVFVAMRFFGIQRLLQEPFPLIVVIISLALGLITATMAIAPGRYWQSWENHLKTVLRHLQQTSLPTSHRLAWLAIVVSWCCFVLMVTQLWQVHTDPTSSDPAAFLRYANEVKQSGGVPALLSGLFRGTYPEANQHPLFTALLSLAPTFSQGKLLSLSIGLLTLVLVTLYTARKWNLTVAAIVSVILSTNYAFCSTSALVTCEGLLTLFVSLTWLILAQPSGPTTETTARSESLGTFLVVGGLLGLAYLTKGTGPLLLIVTLGWVAGCHLYHRHAQVPSASRLPNRFPWKPLAMILLAWLIVSSPLLTRNIRRFGNPVYNDNSYFLFLDQFEDLPQLVKRMTVGEAAQQYFSEHDLVDMFQREAQGFCWESFIFVRSLGPAPWDDSRILFGVPFLFMALAGILAERRQVAMLLLAWIICFLIMFAWYLPIAAGQRFTVPLLPPLLVCVATGLSRLGNSVFRHRTPGPATWVSLALLWCIAWTGLTWVTLP